MSLHVRVVAILLAIALSSCCSAWAWEHVINIDSERGNNTQECIDGRVPCMNLSFAFQPGPEYRYRRNSTQYILHPGTHYLDDSTYNSPFNNLDNFAIVGNGSDSSDTVIECNAPNSSLAFFKVSNVYLERVTFSHCAGLRNSTSRDFSSSNFTMLNTQAALYFYLCSNVSMNLVTVTNSRNATGVIMYNTTGSNTILESTFSNNRVGVNSPYPGGGGFYVEFPYCAPGDENCTSEESNTTANHNASYFFSNCAFTHNKADSIDRSNHSTYILPLGRNHIAFGRGGGLSIFFNGRASGNRVNISNCHFENNTALWGGGLFVEFHDSAGDNHVTVSGSILTGNKCFTTKESGTGGGGMRIGHYVYRGAVGPAGNRIALSGCHFYKNSALNGGALSVSPTLQDTVVHQLAYINISLCYFENNTARLGAAVHIAKFALIVSGNMLNIQFCGCRFVNNSIRYTNIDFPYQTGVGSVYVNSVLVYFRETASFISNSGSALAVVGTPVDFMNCSALFQFNHGDQGGGIALLGASVILINESTAMGFLNNTAEIQGGAIYNKYIERENFATYANCFIRHYNPTLQPNDWEATFFFLDNYDSNGARKNAIYSTSILPCTWAGGSIGGTSGIFCWSHWNESCTEEISSEAGSINYSFADPSHKFLKVFPGQPFQLPLVILDDLNHSISTETVFIATSNDTTVANIEPSFTYVSGETLAVTGIENRNFTLELHSAGNRVWHVQFTVELQNCPPGFSTNNTNSNSTCVCSPNIYVEFPVDCDFNSFNANLSNGFWMGVLPDHNSTLTFVAHCPLSFCYTNPNQSSFRLPESVDKLDALICGKVNRTGIFCGECKDGYGPAVNSETFECVLCNGTNIAANAIYYVLSVYLPLTVLFAVIILFNVRLTTGPANAFIIYSQVVSSTFSLDAEGQIPLNTISNSSRDLLMAYQIPYGIFNLEFIENIISPLCLGTKLNTLDVIALNYVVAVFPLLMMVFVILFMKLKGCFADLLRRLTRHQTTRIRSHSRQKWRIGGGLVHVFAAFLLLSYNKFWLVSSSLVIYQPLYDENGTKIGPKRVYFAGNYKVTDMEYILKYCLPASICFATFVAIPPLLLLGYPVKWLEWCLSKVECLWRFYPVDKVHILLDTFQGCYRNKMRFFAGLYFLFRLILYVTYILTETWIQQFIQQVACTVFIVLISLCQPYTKENKIFNYVDMLTFTNLAILNALSWYLFNFAEAYPGQPIPISAFVIQYILVFLPLLYMIAYVLYDLSRPCHQKIKHRTLESFHMCIRHLFRKPEYRHLDEIVRDDASTTEGAQNEDDVEALFERAEMENTYRPSPVNLPATEVHTYPTGLMPRGSLSEDSGLRTYQSSINNYGSTASRTVSMPTPPDSSGQTTGSSNKVTDN